MVPGDGQRRQPLIYYEKNIYDAWSTVAQLLNLIVSFEKHQI